jgi:hypothetical protein
MRKDLDAVSEVREWRRQMMEGWKGKSWGEIEKELDEHCEEFEKRIRVEEELRQKKEGAA